MSDTPQGLGWWQASDGKWYPPQASSHQESPPPGQTRGSWWSRLGKPGRIAIVAAPVALVLVLGANALMGGGDTSSYDHAAYQAAQEQCKVIGLAQLYALRPNATASNDDDVTFYAGLVNRCIADRLGVDLKYLPNDKPVFGR